MILTRKTAKTKKTTTTTSRFARGRRPYRDPRARDSLAENLIPRLQNASRVMARAMESDGARLKGSDVSSSARSDFRVDLKRQLFPACVVWCPIPLVTHIFPPIGHLGICYADGTVTDFLGPRFVHRGTLGFGTVARYWRLDPSRVVEGGRGDLDAHDAALRRAEHLFNAQEMYNLFGNNCHQYVAHAMNLMAYDGKRDWNMVHLAALVLFRGRWVSAWACAKTWGPCVVVLAACAATGRWDVVVGLFAAFCALVAYFAAYSFGVARPAKKVYETPLKTPRIENEMRGMEGVDRGEDGTVEDGPQRAY